MKKILLPLLLIISGVAQAAGPLFRHNDPLEATYINQEFENVYQDLKRLSGMIAAAIIPSSRINGSDGTADAAPGYLGEYVVASNNAVLQNLSNAAFVNLLTIPLTAGDWEVSGLASFSLNGSTSSGPIQLVVSIFSGTTTTDHSEGDNLLTAASPISSAGNSISVPCYRIKVTTSQTIYLKALGNFSAGTMQARGRISARRVR